MNTSEHLKGFSHKEAHPWEWNASGREVSGKSDRMTWRFEWIEGGIEEGEEVEWRREIGFWEGANFLGAIDKKINKRREEKENMNTIEGSGKKERKNYVW